MGRERGVGGGVGKERTEITANIRQMHESIKNDETDENRS